MRRLAGAVGLALVVAWGMVALAACQSSPASAPFNKATADAAGPKVLPTSPPDPEARGTLLYARVLELRSFDLATRTSQTFLTFPRGAFGGLPAVSPDGKLVAYSLFRPSGNVKEPGGSDLWVVDADGSNPRQVLVHEAPGEALTEPAWGPDSRSLYYTRRPRQGPSQVERVSLDGTGRAVVAREASSPWPSPDGQRLAYLTLDAQTSAAGLWVAGADGNGARRLLGSPEYLQLASPRWSPDGRRIVFSAVGGESAPGPGRSAPSGPGAWLERLPAALGARLGPSVAHAHGVPWDLWLVNPDGSGLKQLTQLSEDAPIATWSPDSRWIAFTGELGLYLVDAEGRQTRRLSEEGSGGGVAWLR